VPRRVFLAPLTLAASAYLLDQGSKYFLSKHLHRPLFLIPRYVGLVPHHNQGIIFGLCRIPFLALFSTLFALLVAWLTLTFLKEYPGSRSLRIGIGLIWGGVAGNLTDRLLSGAVFDFLLLFPIPLFNLADLFLTAGALLILFPVFFVERQRIRV